MRERALLDWLTIDTGTTVPAYRQLTERIADAILRRRLPAGILLPSSRSLALAIGVSRITTLHAYEQLIADGYLEASGGSGTKVASGIGMPTGDADALADEERADHGGEGRLVPDGEPRAPAFRPGIGSFDEFPRLVWARLLRRHGLRNDQFILDYAHPGGYAPLRDALVRYLRSSRGVACTAEQVVVVTSVRAAVQLACAVFLPRGAAAVVGDPGWNTGRRTLRSIGVPMLPIPVDQNGLCVAQLTERAADARLVHVTPTHHWPTGVILSPARRLQLIAWARRNNAWIIEDDYDSEFRFDGPPPGTLHSIADGGPVLYAGTFAKTFAPSVRCAYLVVPKERSDECAQAAYNLGTEPSLQLQAALADLLSEGHFARHLVQMRKLYRRRRDALVDSLAAAFGDQMRIDRPPGGLQLVAELPACVSAGEVSENAARAGILARPMAHYHVETAPQNGLHLGFAAVPEPAIVPAVTRLRAAAAAFL
jgi:GntR family transcriptional regulator/MocR family aminotransferase